MIKHKLKRALATIPILPAAVCSMWTYAQDPGDATGEIEEVVVVGTAIRGTPIDASHAVSTVDREALERQGLPLMVDLFKHLGASNGVVGERNGWFNSSLPTAIPEKRLQRQSERPGCVAVAGAVQRTPADVSARRASSVAGSWI